MIDNTWERGNTWDESGKEGDLINHLCPANGVMCVCVCARVCVNKEKAHKHVSKCDKTLTTDESK